MSAEGRGKIQGPGRSCVATAWLAAAKAAGAVTVNYGLFINAVIKFLIVAFAVFLLVKQVNKLQARLLAGKEEAPALTVDQKLLTEIRDLLRK